MGHRLRRLRDREDRGVPKGVQLRPEARRAALVLGAPRVQPGPVLAFVGGADPQDPITNLPNLKRQFPDSRAVILPHTGHRFYIGSCVDQMMADFVAHGTTKGLDTTRCDGLVVVPPFPLTD